MQNLRVYSVSFFFHRAFALDMLRNGVEIFMHCRFNRRQHQIAELFLVVFELLG